MPPFSDKPMEPDYFGEDERTWEPVAAMDFWFGFMAGCLVGLIFAILVFTLS